MHNQLQKLDDKRAKLHGLLLLLTFGILFVPSFTILDKSSLRFIIYTLPAFSFLFWLISSPNHRFLTDTRFVIAIMIYALLLFISSFTSIETIDKLTWINALRPIFYISAFIPFMIFSNNSVKILVVIFAITTAALWATGGVTTHGEIDLESSQGLLESGLAFPLGGILIYFLLQKQKLWAFITFILFFIAFKRIAFAAVFAIFAMILISNLLQRGFKLSSYKIALGWTFITMVFASFVNLFYFKFFSILLKLMGKDQSVTDLTMGRLQEFGILYKQYGDQPLINLLFGNGAGDATRKLVEITITYPMQVHNSFLLYFYDFGVIGFGLLMLSMLAIFGRTAFGLYLLTYNIIIMITDNTFSHHYHLITYFILISAMQYTLNNNNKGYISDK